MPLECGRVLQRQLRPAFLAWRQRFVAEQPHARQALVRAAIEFELEVVSQRHRRVAQPAQPYINQLSRRQGACRGDHVAALQLFGADAAQVNSQPAARRRAADFFFMGL